MLADVGRPSTKELARTLCVSPSTARRWIAADAAPFPVLLAVFWQTRWGRAEVNAQAEYAAQLYAGYCTSLKDALAKAEARSAQLQRALDAAAIDTANCPVYDGPVRLSA